MLWQPHPVTLALALSVLVSGSVATYAWRKRQAAGALPLAVFMIAAAEWSLAYGLEIGAGELAMKLFWAKAQYLGIVTVAPAMLFIVLEYCGQLKRPTWRYAVPLAIIPLVTLLLAWTNGVHGLIWTEIRLNPSGPFPVLDLEHGTMFWLFLAYSYLCLLAGSGIVVRAYRRSSRLYRMQLSTMLAATLVPWLGNLSYISGLNPLPYLDLTPFAFTITGLVATWALFRFQLFDVVPVARDVVLDSMSDGVIVLDTQARIVDLNPAAQQIMGRSGDDLIGQGIEQALPTQFGWSELLEDQAGKDTQVSLGDGETLRHYDLRISSLIDRPRKVTARVIVLRDTTALKQTENALLRSRQQLEMQNLELRKLSQAVEQSANMVLITDLQGNIEYVNPKFEVITGYPQEEVLGRNPNILQSGEQSDAFYADLWQTIISGQVWHGEFHNKRRDGSLYWEMATIGPIYDPAGEMTHFIAIKEDITDRKQAEEALTQLLELSRVLATTWDMDEAVIRALASAIEIVPSADRGTLQWLEQDAETLRTVASSDSTDVPHNIPLFRPGVGVAGHALASRKVINVPDVLADERFVPGEAPTGFRSLLVAPLVVKDRALGTLSLNGKRASAFSPTDETLIRLVADQTAVALENAQEFTARQEAEEALHLQTARLKTLTEIGQSILAARLPETIAVAAIGRIRQLIPCQRAMVMAVGENGELKLLAAESSGDNLTMAGMDVYQLALRERTLSSGWIHGAEDLAALSRRTPLQRSLYETGVRSFVVVPLFIQDKLVGTLHLESEEPRAFSADHITIASEVAASLTVAIRQARLYARAQQEIAERMQAEAALRVYTTELEARNAELDAFAHTVAHDLKNPVSTILGYTDMLSQKHDTLSDELMREFLLTLARNARKIGTIIDELLVLSSVRDTAEVKTHPLDMGSILLEAHDRLRYMIGEYQGEITQPDSWPTVVGYGPWVEEVWVNYISNALKYGGQPPLIELGADPPSTSPLPIGSFQHQATDGTTELTAKRYVRFWVHDNGPGLSSEEQARLFTPFERLHQIRVEGHGLGLSIVQRIVQKLGGQVGVESDGAIGQGSTFYFTLPAARGQ
jgi:PAS domain S-box-containing protein